MPASEGVGDPGRLVTGGLGDTREVHSTQRITLSEFHHRLQGD